MSLDSDSQYLHTGSTPLVYFLHVLVGVRGMGSHVCLWCRSTQLKVGTSVADWLLYLIKIVNFCLFLWPSDPMWVNKTVNPDHKLGNKHFWQFRITLRRPTPNPCKLLLIYLRRLMIKKLLFSLFYTQRFEVFYFCIDISRRCGKHPFPRRSIIHFQLLYIIPRNSSYNGLRSK